MDDHRFGGRSSAGGPEKSTVPASNGARQALRFLDEHQVKMVDEALGAVGEYGEVRLVVEKGRLRFLITQKSFDALKWHPGSLSSE